MLAKRVLPAVIHQTKVGEWTTTPHDRRSSVDFWRHHVEGKVVDGMSWRIASWKRWPCSYYNLKDARGVLRTPVQRLHHLEASSAQFGSDKFSDSGANSEESASWKVKLRAKTKQAIKKPVSSLQQYWTGGEDVQAKLVVEEHHDRQCN